jgi:hypothetical protein
MSKSTPARYAEAYEERKASKPLSDPQVKVPLAPPVDRMYLWIEHRKCVSIVWKH